MELSYDENLMDITSSLMDVPSEDDGDIYTALTSIPNDLRNRMEEVVKDFDISNLATAFEFCVVMHWKDFSERWLKMSHNHTENIDVDNDKRSIQILQMFHKWREIHGVHATVENIISAFNEAKLLGIKQRWFANYKVEKKDVIESFFQRRAKAILMLSQAAISEERWQRYILSLGVDDRLHDVNDTRDSRSCKRKRILQMFDNRYGFSKDKIILFGCTFSKENLVPVCRLPTTRDTTKDYPFFLRKIRNVRKCQGCEAYFDYSPSKDDLVIAHMEWIRYKKDGGVVEDFTHGHYHYNEKCVRANHKNFNIDTDLVSAFSPEMIS